MSKELYIINEEHIFQNTSDWLDFATSNGMNFLGDVADLKNALRQVKLPCYIETAQKYEDCLFILIYLKNLRDRRLLIISSVDSFNSGALNRFGFEGTLHTKEYAVLECHINAKNVRVLRKIFPHTAPSAPLSYIARDGSSISFGLGDRLGIASFGHLMLFEQYNMVPVLAQQSKRELNLTGRTYGDIIDEASWDIFAYNYRSPWGADGDHLKSAKEISEALEMGCTMITADLSDKIDDTYLVCNDKELESTYKKLDADAQKYFAQSYTESKIVIDETYSLEFSEQELMRIVLTYYEAIKLARELYEAVQSFEQKERGIKIDFEISIDETSVPTTPQAHYFVAQELTRKNIVFHSIAPRFCGEFQKGIDYIGDLKQFEYEIQQHAKIAKLFGYKISVHSGSDKFSIFPLVATYLQQYFHIKTSGTNWLVALQTIAHTRPALFRRLHAKAYEVFDTAKQYYHITPDFNTKEDIDALSDEDLDIIFENDCDRQVIHIAYGEIFKVEELKQKIDEVLATHIETYWNNLNKHIGKHVNMLLRASD